ncbi:MAG: hydrolase [Pirellulaceae bacterium]
MNIAPDLVQHLSVLDGKTEEMRTLVEKLCNQNSGTYNIDGVRKVSEMLADAYGKLGATMERLPTNPMETVSDAGNIELTPLGDALLFTKRAERRPRILLCIHMDTVFGVDHPFQKCRMLDEQTMNGPGVIDAKGGLVVMLYALKAFEASPLANRIGWQVLINPDEELGSPGSNEIIHDLASKADLGLLFEPSLPNGDLISWRKGTGAFHFVVRGRAAHSGRAFHEGRNAITALSRLLVAIDELNTDPEVTYNVGRISGGGALNIVPDLAIGRLNVRIKTVEQQKEVEDKLNRIVAHFNETLDGISITMHGLFTSPPKTVGESTQSLMKRIEGCGAALDMPVSWTGSGGASDGNKFSAAGLGNIDSLGPAGGELHSSSEFLKVDSLVPKAKMAALILLSLAAEQSE